MWLVYYCLPCKTVKPYGIILLHMIFYSYVLRQLMSMYDTQNKCCAFPCAKFLIPHMSSLTKPCHLIQLDTVTECSHLWKNNPHSDWPAERPSAVWLARGGESQRLGTRTKGWRDSISEVILSACFPASCFPAPHPALRFLFLSVSHL